MTTTVAAGRATLEAVRALHAVGRAAVTPDAALERALTARIVPWHTAARVTDDGRSFYRESWEPGSLLPDTRVVVYDGHIPGGGGAGRLNGDRTPIGLAHGFRSEADGLYATLTLFDTSRGRDVYATAVGLGEVDVSLEADVPAGATGTVARTAAAPALLTGVAVVLPPGSGAFPGALATAARAAADDDDTDDDDTDDDTADGDADGGDTGGDSAGRAGVTRGDIAEAVRAEVARLAITGQRDRAGRAGPWARYQSFDAVIDVARGGRRQAAAEVSEQFAETYQAWAVGRRAANAAARAGRAFVDQVTADNPGLMPPSWLTEVFGLIDEGRPSVVAFGGPRSPGDSGMDVNWPYYDGDLRAIVAAQVAEKTAINSVKVSFKRGTATLATYAGGSDVSYQLQRRSTPAYMSLYDRVLQIAYGLTTENSFVDAVATGATGTPIAYDLTTDADGAALKAALFAASSTVKRATGRPANAALAASDVYAALGGQPWLQPPMYGTQNTPGTAAASTLSINVSGLTITEAPDLAAGTMLVSNDSAAAWLEDGPFLVRAEDVEKLGTDVAIWGMGAPGLFLPSGVVKVTVTLPAPAGTSTTRSRSSS